MYKRYSWRSFMFLIFSLLTSLSMVLLDPIASNTTEQIGFFIIVFMLVSSVASIVLAVLTFSSKKEKKNIAIFALFLTILNSAIIAFFVWFGANFS
ncbi:MAG: hypothetical protein ACQEV0_14850 [Bacillota bacterium]